MENSNNSMNKAPKYSSNDTRTTYDDAQSPEESGWTMYLEDFLLQNNNIKEHSGTSPISSRCESLLISDAGSSVNAANKLAHDDEEINVRFGGNINNRGCCNRLSFKKRKTKEAILVDDALEDTASSPVSSPKVFDLNQMGVKPKEEKDDHTNMFEDKGISSGQSDDHVQRSHEQLASFIGKESECTQLKKRGLCLVPLSMLVSYIG